MSIFLVTVAVLIVSVFIITENKRTTRLEFFTANRGITTIIGAFTIVSGWAWGTAFFVSSQQGYLGGFPSWFWFAFPNTLALIVFLFLAKRMHRLKPNGFTLNELIKEKYDKNVSKLYIGIMLLVEVYSVVVQLTAASLLLSMIFGIEYDSLLIIILALTMLVLAQINGMVSLATSDIIKCSLLILLIVISSVVLLTVDSTYWSTIKIDNFNISAVTSGNLVWNMGIPTSIALISGIIISGQVWQRSFSIKTNNITFSFLFGTIIFALILAVLGLLGVLATSKLMTTGIANSQLAGFATLSHLFPIGTAIFSITMTIALIVTGASALNSAGNIFANDIYKVLKPSTTEKELIRASRWSMFFVLIPGTIIALFSIPLILLLQFMGVRVAFIIPTIIALFSNNKKSVPVSSSVVTASIIITSLSYLVLFIGLGLKTEAGLTAIVISSIIILFGYNINHRRLNDAR